MGVPQSGASNADASTNDWKLSVVVSNIRKRSRSVDEIGWDVVYSDGACKGNGKVGPVAGIGVWWGPDDPRSGNFIQFRIHRTDFTFYQEI